MSVVANALVSNKPTFEVGCKVKFLNYSWVGVILEIGDEIAYVDWGEGYCVRKERLFNLVKAE